MIWAAWSLGKGPTVVMLHGLGSRVGHWLPVARELAANDSNLAVRVFAAGFGEHRPVASNGDQAGRAQNRRVEIRLVRRDEPRSVVYYRAVEGDTPQSIGKTFSLTADEVCTQNGVVPC